MSDYTTRTVGNGILAIALSFGLAACGDDGTGPRLPDLTRADVAGHYEMTALTFDPQGSLPEVDLFARLPEPLPSLVLVANGQAQLVSRDPETGLIAVAAATYTVSSLGRVQFTFDQSSTLHLQTLLASSMVFDFVATPRSLVFDATVTGGIDRATLLELVPEWEDEQLFDPVPGVLRVVYQVEQDEEETS